MSDDAGRLSEAQIGDGQIGVVTWRSLDTSVRVVYMEWWEKRLISVGSRENERKEETRTPTLTVAL